MKRFFPFLIGLTLICLSFTYNSEPESSISEDDAVNSVVKICDYMRHYGQNQYQCDPSSADLQIDDDCVGTIKVYVRVTNLTSNPVKGKPYGLPTNADDIYYEYISSGIKKTIGPIDSFVYNYKVGSEPVSRGDMKRS